MAAAKSDFAQKLLHDLRLRKERMGATHNSSSSSKPAFRGGHGNPGSIQKGSKNVTAIEPIRSRSGNSIRKTSGGAGSFHLEGSSNNQIFLYGGGRGAEHAGELSTTLSFAIENGGKFSRIDATGNNPLLTFLRHISRRSFDGNVKMETRSNMLSKNTSSNNTQFPTYSHIHIHDVSRGVQKLNQILRTCSNGVNFDRHSIEVGKELLRGAMDLEESLRMLINMQEASDYKRNSQRKNRIKLLDENEDDEAEIAKENDLKLVARPRFSFDKPRNQQSNKDAAHKQQIMALTYLEGTPRLQEKHSHTRSNSFSHSRSSSSVPDFKSLSSDLESKDQAKSHSKSEKGRISNVVAKLMGLEELTPKEGSNAPVKDLSSNKKGTSAPMASPISVESRRQDERHGRPVTNNKHAETAFRASMWDSKLELEVENISGNPNGSFRATVSDSHRQNLEVAARKYAGPGSKTTTVKAEKHGLNGISERDRFPGHKAMSQEKEKTSNMKTENKEPSLKVVQKQQNEPERLALSKAKDRSVKNMELKRSEIETRNKNVHSQQRSKQQINQEVYELRQRNLAKKSDQLEKKKKEQLPKPKKQVTGPKSTQVEAMVVPKVNKSTKVSQKKKPYGTLAPALAPAAVNKEKPVEITRLHEDHGAEEPSFDLPARRKNGIHPEAIENKTCQVNVASNAISAIPDALPASPDLGSAEQKKKEQQNDKILSSCPGEEQESSNHSEEAEVCNTRLDEPEERADSSNVEDLFPHVAEEVKFSLSGEDECQIVDIPESQLSNEKPHLQNTETVTNKHEVPEDQILGHRATEPLDKGFHDCHKGQHGDSKERSKPIQIEPKKMQAKRAAEPLTEPEKRLKEKLIKGQQFLNTAEAYFKLNIPVSILDSNNDHSGQDAETKLILDCGYELLKKKGQRLENPIYPRKEISVTYANKVKSLDDLIKQLSKDFNTLKSYGGINVNPEFDTADCLSKMLEKDFEKAHLDVNSMWDVSWNSDPFGFQEYDEIVKDVEKHLLNGLLDGITKELLQLGIVLA